MLDFPRWKIITILGFCAFLALLAVPNFLSQETRQQLPSWVPSKTVNLGLDLRGGSHLLLEVEFAPYLKEQLASLKDELRLKLRKQKIGYSGLVAGETQVRFQLVKPGDAAEEALSTLVKDINPDLSLELSDGGQVSVVYGGRALEDMQRKLLEQSLEIVNRRVNETGTREPTIQRQGVNRILLQVPGLEDPEKLKALLGKTAKMTFHLVDMSMSPQDIAMGKSKPGVRILPSDDPSDRYSDGSPVRYAVKRRVALSGDLLTNSSATFSEGEPVVAFKFNTLGARKFGRITSENVGKPFAVVLDGKVITAPNIRVPILDGSGIIQGSFTVESANDLALLLRSGALPAPLKVLEERTVGASLGADSIAAGEKAAMGAVLLVMVFMLMAYGRFGIYSNISLIVNMVIILAALSLFQATLTLPGIAGIVLTLGMAVDANVLIFERIREEIRVGKTPFAAVDNGFKSAFSTIMDANLTTLIAALLLFYFGSGTIKGFAVTLSIGIVSSMFSAILLTRMQVVLWLKRVRPSAIPI